MTTPRILPALLLLCGVFMYGELLGQQENESSIVYGGDHRYPPFEFLDEAGQPAGFHIDLMNAISTVMGFDVTYELGPWSEIRHKFEVEKSIDMSDMFYTRFRRGALDYVAEHAIISHQIVARKETYNIESLSDIKGLRVLVEASSAVYELLRDSDLDLTLIPVETEIYALRQLAAGKYDIAVTSQYQAHVFIEKYGLKNLSIEGPMVFPLKLSFVVRKGNTDLRERINTGLEIIKRTGEYSRIYVKWFGEEENGLFGVYLKWILLVSLGVAVLAVFWILSLKGQVAKKTRELEQQLNMKIGAERRVASKNLELEKRNKELDQFAYSIAHDIRSPLTSILGLVEVMKLEIADQTTQNYVGKLEQSGKRLTSYVDQVLTYSSSTQPNTDPEDIDFEELINASVALYEYLDGADRIKIHHTITLEKPFRSDKNKMSLIFNNLICNAIQFQKKDEPSPFLDIAVAHTSGALQVTFQDNGEGIALNRQEAAFKMFYRGSNKSQGSGLGLYITKEAVLKLNGTIKIESRENEGTTLVIRLPYPKA